MSIPPAGTPVGLEIPAKDVARGMIELLVGSEKPEPYLLMGRTPRVRIL